jgi:hypothetical protein
MLITRWDCFESRDIVRLLGIAERELRYWAVLGIVKPEIAQSTGKPGNRRRYSFKNLVQAGLVQMLLANHISLHTAPKVLRFVGLTGFFLQKPKQLYLVLHHGDLLQAYVRYRAGREPMKMGMPGQLTDLGHSSSQSLGEHLDALLEDPAELDSFIVIAVHRVRDRLATKLGKTLADL